MKVDDFAKHEVLHMASVFEQMVLEHLVEHPAVEHNLTWKKLAKEAAGSLSKLYLQIGKDTLG